MKFTLQIEKIYLIKTSLFQKLTETNNCKLKFMFLCMQYTIIQIMLENIMRKDFDSQLGRIGHVVSRRGNVAMISITTRENLISTSSKM